MGLWRYETSREAHRDDRSIDKEWNRCRRLLICSQYKAQWTCLKIVHFSRFLGNCLFITADRAPHIEYLSATILAKFAFVFRAPPLTNVENIYYLPFAGIVWICTIVLVVLSTMIIYITYRFSKEKEENLVSSDFLLFAVGTICQMGSDFIPTKMSGKIATVNMK